MSALKEQSIVATLISRLQLNESHEGQIPGELLSMSVSELLDKVGELDTNGDAEYEIIEDALIALKDKILGNGYSNDEVNFTPDNGVEAADDPAKIISDEDEDIPTFDQVSGGEDTSQNQGGLDFEF